MSSALPSLDALNNVLKQKLEDEGFRKAVREYFRKYGVLTSLIPQKLKNWKDEKTLPKSLLEGAVMALLARQESSVLPVDCSTQSADCPKLEADTAWYVFYVGDRPSQPSGDKPGDALADVHVWRYWEGIRPTREEPPYSFASTNLFRINFDPDDFRSFGGDGSRFTIGEKSRRSRKVTFIADVNGATPSHVGHWLMARKAQATWTRKDKLRSCLSAVWAIPVRRVYFVANIPLEQLENQPLVLHLPSHLAAEETLQEHVFNQESLFKALDRKEDVEASKLLSSCGDPEPIDKVKHNEKVPAPAPLGQAFDDVRKVVGGHPLERRPNRAIFFKAFENPYPGIAKVMVYRMPAYNGG